MYALGHLISVEALIDLRCRQVAVAQKFLQFLAGEEGFVVTLVRKMYAGKRHLEVV
jgi:hypothetical protein